MTQTPKVLIALVILAVTGVAANRLARPGSGLGEQCRRAVGDAQRHCYSQLLSERLADYGVADAMKTLEQLAVADPYMTEHAHEYAHGIGIESFTRYPDIVSTFVACGDGSASGCRHGFVQAYLESRDSITAPELQGLCQPFKTAEYSRALLFQCIHGMGHGLTMFHGHDARPATASRRRSFKDCVSRSRLRSTAARCSSNAFTAWDMVSRCSTATTPVPRSPTAISWPRRGTRRRATVGCSWKSS